MATVGVRELKNRLSYYLDLVRKGERVVVTGRGAPIAEISPIAVRKTEEEVWQDLIARGLVTGGSGKPQGLNPRIKVFGKPVSETLLEDRGEPLP